MLVRNGRRVHFDLTDPLSAPHVGHLYTLVLTDILKRWQVLLGRKAILCTGTDEHGMKVGNWSHSLICERC